MSREFAGMSRTPGGVQKVCEKMFVRIFRSLSKKGKPTEVSWRQANEFKISLPPGNPEVAPEGISPKLLPALRWIYLSLSTPVLSKGQLRGQFSP